MSDGLRNGVIQVLGVRGADLVMLVHSRGLEANLKVDVVAAQVLILEVGKQLGFLLGEGNLEGCESLRGDNPGADGGTEILGVEGSKRNIFPNLKVTS